MKDFPTHSSSRIKVILTLLLSAPWVGLAQESLPYLVGTGTQLELVGFPVHSPALDAGTANTVAGTLVGWSPSFTDRPFGSGLRVDQEYYAEIVGPAGHTWLGHRFELDEVASRARIDHGLVAATSPFNTQGLPNSSLVGARLEVRPHLTVAGLWGATVRNRIVYGGEKDTFFSFSVAAPGATVGTRSVTASLPRPTDALRWIDAFTRSPVTLPMLIPPGTAVAATFGQRRGSSLGFTGESRSWPTAAPLQAGANLLAYPYPRDMRLGTDWGTSREGFRALARPSPAQDRIELLAGTSRRSFAPEAQAGGGIRWRLLDPVYVNARWAMPVSYLDTIPVGEGFLLRKNRADATHVFHPPKP
jgi:hypothetical protein